MLMTNPRGLDWSGASQPLLETLGQRDFDGLWLRVLQQREWTGIMPHLMEMYRVSETPTPSGGILTARRK